MWERWCVPVGQLQAVSATNAVKSAVAATPAVAVPGAVPTAEVRPAEPVQVAAPQPGVASQPSERRPDRREEGALRKAVERLNKTAAAFDVRARFAVHEALNQVVVTVYDMETNTVIREIPPRKVLDVVARIMELAGVLVDETA